ncbi:MAG: glycerate kinase [Prevotellaceae bacterium]|jgi:glycerate kinase|nr:glycerate kinase [Prevotellaceae bacterium]
MRVLVAPDSFKENLDAKQVSAAIEKGIKNADPLSEIQLCPMADGGEGSMQTLVEYTQGSYVDLHVCNPLLTPIPASYGVLGDGETVVVESAATIGLGLLKQEERNPLKTSSYGVGLLIRHAIGSGYRKIVICIGGTATNDGGAGMLQAMGCYLYKNDGKCISTGNQALSEVYGIDTSKMDDLLDGCELILASDVINPLLGANGATYVFAQQKGANEKDLPLLESNLKYYAAIIAKTAGTDFSSCPGAGAAGGLGFAFMSLMGAKMRKGVELMIELLNVEAAVTEADIIFTGEGSVDFQTSFGKVISGIAALGQKHDKPVAALCGRKVGDMSELYKAGLTAVFSIADSPMSIEKSMSDAESLLENQAEQVMRLFMRGTTIKKKY